MPKATVNTPTPGDAVLPLSGHRARSSAARIVTVADTFDALTSPRPCKPAWRTADAHAHLDGKVSGGQLDAD